MTNDTSSKKDKQISVNRSSGFKISSNSTSKTTNCGENAESSKPVLSFKFQDLLDREAIVLDKDPIFRQLKSKTVLITGAAGSIGSEIVRQVINFGPKKIIILDQAETPLHHLKLELKGIISNSTIETVICDVRNKETLKETFVKYKPQVVFHVAAYKHVPMMEENPSQAVFTNVLGTKNTADLSIEFGVNNFVFVSTDKAVNPSNVMGASKRIAEKYIQYLFFNTKEENTPTTKFITTRFGNVLGSSGSVVPLFMDQIQNGGPVTITHPDIIRYFMTITEACQLVLEAGAMGNGGEIFIFDMGQPIKIVDLAIKMIRLSGLIPEKDIELKIVGLRPGEKLYEELSNKSSKTLPTHNKNIVIIEDICCEYSSLSEEIDDLIAIAKTSNRNSVVSKMKSIVPEFISMNSEFNKLDV